MTAANLRSVHTGLFLKGSINEIFHQGHDLKSKSQRLRGYIIGIVRPTLTKQFIPFLAKAHKKAKKEHKSGEVKHATPEAAPPPEVSHYSHRNVSRHTHSSHTN